MAGYRFHLLQEIKWFSSMSKKKKKNTCQITNYRNYSLCRTNATQLSSPAYLFPNTPPPPRLINFRIFKSRSKKNLKKRTLVFEIQEHRMK